MVNEAGQLYTLEGLAAGALMIVTAYLVMNATTILTPGDTHVNDMQLAQLGNDVLKMIDTPSNIYALSIDENNLATWIKNNNTAKFTEAFYYYWPHEKAPGVLDDQVKFIAKVYYRNSSSGEVRNFTFCKSQGGTQYLRENAVTVTRWVTVDNNGGTNPMDHQLQAVLLEVLIWRD